MRTLSFVLLAALIGLAVGQAAPASASAANVTAPALASSAASPSRTAPATNVTGEPILRIGLLSCLLRSDSVTASDAPTLQASCAHVSDAVRTNPALAPSLPLLARMPGWYAPALLVLLGSHVVQALAGLPHLLLTLPASTSAHRRTTALLSGRSASLYSARRAFCLVHAVAIGVGGAALLAWRRSASTRADAFNATLPAPPLRAEVGSVFGVLALAIAIAAVACAVERRTLARDVIAQQAREDVSKEWIKWGEACEARCADLAAQAQVQPRHDKAPVTDANTNQEAQPPAYPTAVARGAHHLQVEIDAVDNKGQGEKAPPLPGQIDEPLSWRLVGDRSGRVYN